MYSAPNQTAASMKILNDIAARIVYKNKAELPETVTISWINEHLMDHEVTQIRRDPWFKFVNLRPDRLSCANFIKPNIQALIENVVMA